MADQKNPSGHPDKFRGSRGPARSERRRMAESAGLSRHQMHQALAVASIPQDEFERMVESDDLPNVTQLAAIGAGRSPSPRRTPFDRLITAWNAADDDQRTAFLAAIGLHKSAD